MTRREVKPGDVCEVEIEAVGPLRNPVAQEGKTGEVPWRENEPTT